MPLHLIKMAAGITSISHLAARQRHSATYDPEYQMRIARHWTRHTPRRSAEIIGTGSIYWIFQGAIRARQRIIALERHDKEHEDGTALKSCAIVYDVDHLILTHPAPRRPHQGWRYFEDADIPPDLSKGTGVDPDMPPDMQADLMALGIL